MEFPHDFEPSAVFVVFTAYQCLGRDDVPLEFVSVTMQLLNRLGQPSLFNRPFSKMAAENSNELKLAKIKNGYQN